MAYDFPIFPNISHVISSYHEKSKSSLVLHDDVLVEDCSAGGLADHLGHHALVELGQAQVEGDAAVLHLGLAGRVWQYHNMGSVGSSEI